MAGSHGRWAWTLRPLLTCPSKCCFQCPSRWFLCCPPRCFFHCPSRRFFIAPQGDFLFSLKMLFYCPSKCFFQCPPRCWYAMEKLLDLALCYLRVSVLFILVCIFGWFIFHPIVYTRIIWEKSNTPSSTFKWSLYRNRPSKVFILRVK